MSVAYRTELIALVKDPSDPPPPEALDHVAALYWVDWLADGGMLNEKPVCPACGTELEQMEEQVCPHFDRAASVVAGGQDPARGRPQDERAETKDNERRTG